MAERRSPMGTADGRPRIYIRQTMDYRFAWRMGVGGLETPAHLPGEALNAALKSIDLAPAVIFWEGLTDG